MRCIALLAVGTLFGVGAVGCAGNEDATEQPLTAPSAPTDPQGGARDGRDTGREQALLALDSFVWSAEGHGIARIATTDAVVQLVAKDWQGQSIWQKEIAPNDIERRVEIRIQQPGYYELFASSGTRNQSRSVFVLPDEQIQVPEELQRR